MAKRKTSNFKPFDRDAALAAVEAEHAAMDAEADAHWAEVASINNRARKLIAEGKARRYSCDDRLDDLPEEIFHNRSFFSWLRQAREVAGYDDEEIIQQSQRDCARFLFEMTKCLQVLTVEVVADDLKADLKTVRRNIKRLIRSI